MNEKNKKQDLNTNKNTGIGISVKNCSKVFPDGTRALYPIDLEVKAGETVVVLGPSGCGKTTTLRIIAGLENPEKDGKVFFDKNDVTNIPIEKRNVGMVFQNYALFPNMDVFDNIAYGLKQKKLYRDSIKKRVEEMISLMNIGKLKYRNINQLSGGERQRVALARAIAVQPQVLLLDEPLTALDAKLRNRLRIEIDILLRSLGITTVYVTHDQSEAMSLADRIVVMDHGKISMIGTPREVYFEPINEYVAQFIGIINRIKVPIEDNKIIFPDAEVPVDEAPKIETVNEKDIEVFFRPEHISVSRAKKGHFSANILSATFVGNRSRLLLQGPFDNKIEAEISGKEQYSPAEKVNVFIDLEQAFTLKKQH